MTALLLLVYFGQSCSVNAAQDLDHGACGEVQTITLPPASVNQKYSADLNFFADKGASKYVSLINDFPKGLSFNAKKGIIRGVPTMEGNYLICLKASNNNEDESRAILVKLVVGSGNDGNCSNTSTGLKPLSELGTALYLGKQGGYYPDGSNVRPEEHTRAGLEKVKLIQPLDSEGNPDEKGAVVFLSIGMSNAAYEFNVFQKKLYQLDELNPSLVSVNGAAAGQTANLIAKPESHYWARVIKQLNKKGVTNNQVQIVWLKEANPRPKKSFIEYAEGLSQDLESIFHILKIQMPNLKIVYVSNRSYGGYATRSLNPEPFAYQTGFSVKWLIERYIRKNLSSESAADDMPWLDWGPDLWADGLVARSSDGLTWECQDFMKDGLHPSLTGREKVANILLEFLKRDPVSRRWLLKNERGH